MTHDREIALWHEYLHWERAKATLWLYAREAFRGYIQSQTDDAWNVYERIIDRYYRIIEHLDQARSEWMIVCKTTYGFPLDECEKSAVSNHRV